METCQTESKQTIKSYVLRAGRITPAQKNAYEKLSQKFVIQYKDSKVILPELFSNNNPVILEIGFGMGIATAQIAESNPNTNYLGIEVHKPGIGRLLWEIEKRNLSNIKIIEYDAVDVMQHMMHSSLAGIHIFFPDPWPKKRHYKRRLVKRPFTDLLRQSLKPGGYVYMVTDWENYGEFALGELSATTGLQNAYEGFAPHQEWRPLTKFEQRGLAQNHTVYELMFLRNN